MKALGFILACLWYTRILKNILSYVHLWYVKEYRWDRMIIHLKTKQGRQILNPPSKNPPISLKTIVFVVLLIASTAGIILLFPFNPIINAIVADILTFPLSFVFVLVLRIPTRIYHTFVIEKALRLMRSHKPMIVVGVTGSFGKTSTKEFLASILSEKYNVLKTEASKNSAIGIAEVIVSRLKPDHEVFIVEMGAYKRGEIARMASMVKPDIGIITAINAQHQDLFGSIETTMKAKYELIQGLKYPNIAVINVDTPYTEQIAEWAKRDKKITWLVTQKKVSQKCDRAFTYSNIRSTTINVSFDISANNRVYPLTVAIRGEHFAQNISMSIAGAVAAGMTMRDAVSAAKKHIQPVDRVMELSIGSKGQQLINDTFNNNPDAAIAALRYMTKFPGKKYLVFQPMIELGGYTKEGHRAVGVEAGKLCDEIILTNNNFSEGFLEGVSSVKPKKYVQTMDADNAVAFLRKHSNKNDTILFKGKEAAFVFKQLV